MSDKEPRTSRGAADIERWIRTELAARVGIDPSRFDRRERFNRYGLDSAKAAAFTVDLSKYLDRILPPTLVWDHPSIDRLVSFLTSAPAAQTVPSAKAAPAGASAPRVEPIAIVGMACRLPGAPDLESYWRLMADGVDAIREVPEARWNIDALFDADVSRAGKMNTRWGGFLDNVDRFDAEAFGISPREAAHVDPQQRLALELSWEAFEDAGIRLDRLKGSATAVFIGAMWSDYARLSGGDLEAITQHTATGQDTSIIPARVSYFFGLQGPSMAVNTACSSSLVSVHLACQSIRSGEVTLALAGGISLVLAPDSTIAMSKFGAMAQDGRSKAFDARANGYVRGEGGGIVVLKALSRAIADGDRIYCVIAGSAVNNDGFSNGLTAPNPRAQEEVLRLAYARAGVPTGDVQYVEAHGTGTLLGDPIEAGALGVVLGAGRAADRPLVIGSVKTNIGHLEAAAGIAGLIKVALSISKRRLPPTLHFETPNPHIRFGEWGLRVQNSLTGWPDPAAPAIAGVSSFGFGGTNAHIVLKEAAPDVSRLLPLSGADPLQLKGAAAACVDAIESMGLDLDLDAYCRTVALQSQAGPSRAAVRFASRADLVRKLRSLAASDDTEALDGVTVGDAADAAAKMLFVCSGHGSQWLGMGRGLLSSEPVFRAKLRACDAVFREVAGWSVLDEMLADTSMSRLSETDVGQPLIFALQVSLAALWQSWGIVPDGVVGHSMGEASAAHIAGVLTLEDAARLIVHRSRLLTRTTGLGALAVLGLSRPETDRLLEQYRDRLWVAACNSPATTVISGEIAAVHEVVATVSTGGTFARLVNVDVSSHTPLVDPFCAELLEAVRDFDPQRETLQIFSTVTGASVSGRELGASYWIRNLRQPVLFEAATRAAVRAGYGVFVELSGHPILQSSIEQTVADEKAEAMVLGSLRRDEDDRSMMLESLGRLYVRGHAVRWESLYRTDRILPLGSPVSGPVATPVLQVPVVLSAHSQEALVAAARSMAAFVRERDDVILADISHSTTIRRTPLERRFAAVADSRATLLDQLDGFIRGEERPRTSSGAAVGHPTLMAVFGEEGMQHPGMGLDLARAEPEFRRSLGQCEAIFRRLGGWSLLAELAASGEKSRLDRAEFAQPAIFALQVSLAALWRSWGVVPEAVLGLGIGEVAAAHVAGVLSLEEAAAVIFHRGRIIQEMSGSARTASEGADVRIQEALGEALAGLTPRSGRSPLFSTVTGAQIESWEMDVSYWARGLGGDVRLEAAVAAAFEGGYNTFLEIGPHPTLKAAIERCARAAGEQVTIVGSLCRERPALAALLDSAAALHVIGQGIDWVRLSPAEGGNASLPAYPWQRSRYWIDKPARVIAREADGRGAAGALPEMAVDGRDWMFDLVWRERGPSPSAQTAASRAAEGRRRWFVLADRGGTGAAIAEILRARSEECMVAPLDTDSPAAFATLFATPGSDCSDIVIDLRAVDEHPGKPAGSGPLTEASIRACARVIQVTKALVGRERTKLWLVTRAAQPSAKGPTALAQSPIWGLGRVVGLEHPELWGGLIDLDQTSSPDDLTSVLDHVRAADEEDQIALRDGQLRVLRLVASADRSETSAPVELAAGASYLITGGSGKLGLKVAQWMADGGARHLVLASRRGVIDAAVLRRLQRNGVEITAAAVDVCDAAAMGALFKACEAAGRPIRGVVHAAGVSFPRPVTAIDEATLAAEFAAKVRGAWVLHELTAARSLDFFVLFSSASSVLGARDRGAYSAANHFLDAMAHERRRLGLPALSVNWGRWDAVGVADDKEQAFWDRIGLKAMPADVGLSILARLIADGSVQRLVAQIDWQLFKQVYTMKRVRPLLEDVVASDVSIAMTGDAPPLDDLLERLGQASAKERALIIADRVGREVSSILGLDPSNPIDPSRGFSQMGLDSLMALELKHRLQVAFRQSLPATAIFNYPTVSALAGLLGARAGGERPAPGPDLRDRSDAEAFDDLSEQEAESLLAARLAALTVEGLE